MHVCRRHCGSGWRQPPAALLPARPQGRPLAQRTGASSASTWLTPTTWMPAPPHGATQSPLPARSRLRRPLACARCATRL